MNAKWQPMSLWDSSIPPMKMSLSTTTILLDQSNISAYKTSNLIGWYHNLYTMKAYGEIHIHKYKYNVYHILHQSLLAKSNNSFIAQDAGGV